MSDSRSDPPPCLDPEPLAPGARPQLGDLLADGQLHSGADLARQLGLSRAAVWKQVRELRLRHGLDIQAERGQGYRLRGGWERLDEQRIRAELAPDIRDRLAAIQVHLAIDSTNAWLMAQARAGAPSGTLCLAEQQTGGRGRRGRRWVSPAGGNLYLSLLWRYALPPARLGALSLACGVAVLRALERIGVPQARIKWPNDLLWDNRKLAGLLLEVGGEMEGPSFVVVGVGVNVRVPATSGTEIDQPWCHLAEIPGAAAVRRNRLASGVASELVRALELFGRDGLAPFLPDWHQRDQLRGAQVVLDLGTRRVQGRCLGIAPNGALRLDLDGQPQEFQVGEVSLRRAAEGD